MEGGTKNVSISHMETEAVGQTTCGGEKWMKHPSLPGYLCLTDLLDQNLSAYEYFQTLSPSIQDTLRRTDSGVSSFDELQARAAHLQSLENGIS